MKNKILESLKAKFQGVSEDLLSRIAEKLAKTANTDEEVETAVAGVTFQQIIDSEADARATKATQSAVANYEKKYGLKEGRKDDNGGNSKKEPKKKEGDDNGKTPEWVESILKNQKDLADKLAQMEGEKIASSRKQKLNTIIEKLPESLQKPYTWIKFEDFSEEDFSDFLSKTQKEVEVISTDISSKGAVFGTPMNGNKGKGQTEPSKEDVEKIINNLM
jgi:hypothetical protein